MLERKIPDERRGEVLHLSEKSMRLAGYTLTFIGLIIAFFPKNPETLVIPSYIFLLAFICLLGLSQYTRQAVKRRDFFIGEILHKSSTFFVVFAALWIFYVIYSIEMTILVVVGFLYAVYLIADLVYIYRDLQSLGDG